VPVDEVERMLALYRSTYRGWNVKHFHERLVGSHGFLLGLHVDQAQLQAAGLVDRAKRRGRTGASGRASRALA
jgi:hypothetical protein